MVISFGDGTFQFLMVENSTKSNKNAFARPFLLKYIKSTLFLLHWSIHRSILFLMVVVCSREKAAQSQFLSAVTLISIHIHFVPHPNNLLSPSIPPFLAPEFLSNFPHFLLHWNQFSWAHISFFIVFGSQKQPYF